MSSILNTALEPETLKRFKAHNKANNYLPAETLAFSTTVQSRLEHRKRKLFELTPHPRRGIENVINYSYSPALGPLGMWEVASSQANSGESAAHIGVVAAEPEIWAELESFSSHQTSREEITLQPKSKPLTSNAFIQARISVQPLLSVLNFKTVSPLLSILWADTTGCSLYDYYHFLRWYAQLRSLGTTKKVHLGDKRERLDRPKLGAVFQGVGLAALDASNFPPMTPKPN